MNGPNAKGAPNGTILVNLERHTVIDVLDDHSTEGVEQWLRTHSNVHTICRDRNGRYAKAARRATPAARQVSDRFHLVQNLRETIERELALHRAYPRVRPPHTIWCACAPSRGWRKRPTTSVGPPALGNGHHLEIDMQSRVIFSSAC
jgi:hypothetical protein